MINTDRSIVPSNRRSSTVGKSTERVRRGAHLSPRRKDNAKQLLMYICWHGSKIQLDRAAFEIIAKDCGLDSFDVRLAADDLYALGTITMWMCGSVMWVKALSRDLFDLTQCDTAHQNPKEKSAVSPSHAGGSY